MLFKSHFLSACLLIFQFNLTAQPKVNYAPAWFGPNANPVPAFNAALIPAKTELNVMSDFYFGYGDNTLNTRIEIEVPLISEFVSVKLWNTPFEYFNVTPAMAANRSMADRTGFATGDYYFQTRIKILNQQKRKFDLVCNATMKTASGNQFENRRYFNTAGYYFDLELGKSFQKNSEKTNIRIAANLGFMSWITSVHTQDDALLYGIQFIFSGKKWESQTSFSGYWGWMHTHPKYGPEFGDAPMIASTRLKLNLEKTSYFCQYQYGISDFPYHQIRLGVNFRIDKLTPSFHNQSAKSN
jgi:hypothetical protein